MTNNLKIACTQAAVKEYVSDERKIKLASHAIDIANEWLKTQAKTGKLDKRAKRKAQRECYNHLLSANLQPSEFGFTSIVFWFVLRSILWWVAQKIIEEYFT